MVVDGGGRWSQVVAGVVVAGGHRCLMVVAGDDRCLMVVAGGGR